MFIKDFTLHLLQFLRQEREMWVGLKNDEYFITMAFLNLIDIQWAMCIRTMCIYCSRYSSTVFYVSSTHMGKVISEFFYDKQFLSGQVWAKTFKLNSNFPKEFGSL